MVVLLAPTASAGETVGPEDAAGCTTTYLDEAGGPYILPYPPVTVSYVPPSSISVSADATVDFAGQLATHLAFATYDYVNCLR